VRLSCLTLVLPIWSNTIGGFFPIGTSIHVGLLYDTIALSCSEKGSWCIWWSKCGRDAALAFWVVLTGISL
jgi:hypothetical protein